MIALMILVTLILLAALPLGCILMSWLGARTPADRPGDRLMLMVWSGFLGLGAGLLTLALAVPLSPGVAAVAAAASVGLWLQPSVRSKIGEAAAGTGWTGWAGAATILAVAAFLCSGHINNRDAISYQHDMIEWLSRAGIAPGLNLVETRFGFLSSWMTFGALANHGWLTARMGSLANASAFFLAMLHLWIALKRLAGGRGGAADRLLAVAGLHAGFRGRRAGAWIGAAAIAATVLLPWTAGMTVVSGCPLYPAPVALNVPWANPDGARRDAELVRTYARWHRPTVPDDAVGIAYPSLPWLRRWLSADVSNAAGFALLLAALAASLALVPLRRRVPPAAWWSLGAGLAGIAYVILLAPVPRFGWGYLAIPPGLLAAAAGSSRAGRFALSRSPRVADALACIAILIPALGLGRMEITASEKRLRAWLEREAPCALGSHWILPPEIPLIRYDDARNEAHALRDYRPAADWKSRSTRPMYFPLEPRPGIRYRDPPRGTRGGFVKSEEASR